jgi:hypothetical protein
MDDDMIASTMTHFYFDTRRNAFVPFHRFIPDLIIKGLYLGDRENAYDSDLIMRYGITHVLSIMVVDLYGHMSHFEPYVKIKVIPVLDETTANIKQYFQQANDFIDEGLASGGNVLVHCVWGMSRSSAIVMAYIMHHYNVNFSKSFNLVRHARPIAIPNKGFVNQLIEYSEEHQVERHMVCQSVEFSVHYMTKFGENLHIVGNSQELGNWTPTQENKMKWVGSGIWSITKPIFGHVVEYKYIKVSIDGHITWEIGDNHLFDGSRRFVRDSWRSG